MSFPFLWIWLTQSTQTKHTKESYNSITPWAKELDCIKFDMWNRQRHASHLLLDSQIHDRRASLFLDGLEEDGTPFATKHLTNMLSDISEDGAMWVGLSSNGKYVLF